MPSDLTIEEKRLFLEVHEEYEYQAPTLGDTPYIQELLDLQYDLFNKKKSVGVLRRTFEQLKADYSNVGGEPMFAYA